MKIVLGLAACVLCSAGLSASADPEPRYKPDGTPCTAEEIANPQVMKRVYRGQTIEWKVECQTKAQLGFAKFQAANQAEQKRANDRGFGAVMNTQGYSYRAPNPEGVGPRNPSAQ